MRKLCKTLISKRDLSFAQTDIISFSHDSEGPYDNLNARYYTSGPALLYLGCKILFL